MNKLRRAGKASRHLLSTAGSTLFGRKPPKPPGEAGGVPELEAYVNELVRMSRPPGLSLVVVKEGQIVYEKSFGLADCPKNVVATPDTVFQWMSMTKMTTAVAIVQLHERQALDIYTPERAVDGSLPVMFWIHGGGWQVGDKSDVALKPKVLTERGFVFVSTNYRLLPHVEMDVLIMLMSMSAAAMASNIRPAMDGRSLKCGP